MIVNLSQLSHDSGPRLSGGRYFLPFRVTLWRMPIIRVDDVSVAPGAKTFAGHLEALGPDYQIQITLEESEWLPHAVEHIKVFIQSPLGVAAIATLSREIVDLFRGWVKDRGAASPAQNHQKLTIYGPDNKAVKVIVAKGEEIDEK
jgi:hypothetical protein